MNIKQIKTKLAVLDTPGVYQQVLLDFLCIYVGEVRGEEVDIKNMVELTEAIVFSLRKQYLAQLPKKDSKIIQLDLEDSIREIKSHPDYEKLKEYGTRE